MPTETLIESGSHSPPQSTRFVVEGMTCNNCARHVAEAIQSVPGVRTAAVNLAATADFLRSQKPAKLLFVCSGTFDEPALEDILAAGAICERIWPFYAGGHTSDSAEVARRLYPLLQFDLLGVMKSSRNGRRLLANPELRNDVWYCVQRETIPFAAELGADGAIRRRLGFPSLHA